MSKQWLLILNSTSAAEAALLDGGCPLSLPRRGFYAGGMSQIAWPSTESAYDACMANVKALLRYGAHVVSSVEALGIHTACSQMGISDLDSVGLVLRSGAHPRRHEGRETQQRTELRQH